MVRGLLLIKVLVVMSIADAFGQGGDYAFNKSIRYCNKEHYLIEGTHFSEAEKENPFDRLPTRYKNKVRKEVWVLSQNSAGISIRFISNSSVLKVKWEVLHDVVMPHMTNAGIKGIDLYCKQNSNWQYVSTAIPQGKTNEVCLVKNMKKEWREYQLFLPLYDGVVNLEIGIDSLSEIKVPEKKSKKPIVFYGTSITQGGCASRPGMVYTSIIGRTLDVECINFGFSGNGRMEREVVEAISEIDAAFFVIDCIPNMKLEDIHANVQTLVEILRKKHPETPIVFVEALMYEDAFLDENKLQDVVSRNDALKDEYKKLKASGIKQVYYIEGANGIGEDHEATVDGVHFTDLGFIRFSDYLMKKFKKYGL